MTVDTVWADKMERQALERFVSAVDLATLDAGFLIRYRDDIDASWRIRDSDGDLWDIAGTTETERRRWLLVTARKTGPGDGEPGPPQVVRAPLLRSPTSADVGRGRLAVCVVRSRCEARASPSDTALQGRRRDGPGQPASALPPLPLPDYRRGTHRPTRPSRRSGARRLAQAGPPRPSVGYFTPAPTCGMMGYVQCTISAK